MTLRLSSILPKASAAARERGESGSTDFRRMMTERAGSAPYAYQRHVMGIRPFCRSRSGLFRAPAFQRLTKQARHPGRGERFSLRKRRFRGTRDPRAGETAMRSLKIALVLSVAASPLAVRPAL